MLPGESQMFSFENCLDIFVPQLSLTQVIPTSHIRSNQELFTTIHLPRICFIAAGREDSLQYILLSQ